MVGGEEIISNIIKEKLNVATAQEKNEIKCARKKTQQKHRQQRRQSYAHTHTQQAQNNRNTTNTIVTKEARNIIPRRLSQFTDLHTHTRATNRRDRNRKKK